MLLRYNLGACYEGGDGVEQDRDEAAKWYLLSAKQGDQMAQKCLAVHIYVENDDGTNELNALNAF